MVVYSLDIERSEDAWIELTTIILKDFLYIYSKFLKRIIMLISIRDRMLWRAMVAPTLHKQCIYDENILQITVYV